MALIKRDDLELEIIPCKGGHSYQWHDPHGRIVCSGWHAGDEAETREVAVRHLESGTPSA